MKKGDYIKQNIDELLTGEISYEEPELFKVYFQLKAHCFKQELKDDYMSYKHAIRVFNEELINKLIDEEYIYRINEGKLDYLVIPSITDNVFGITDYSKINSIKGFISGVKRKMKICNEKGDNTDKLEAELKELQLQLIDENTNMNTRLNTCSTIKNNIKENNRIKDNTKEDNIIENKIREELNNSKQQNIKEDKTKEEINEYYDENDLPF
jgi:signal recognition particle GTPase